ncbi:hypothetical protein Y032_0043g826 [Ancylostoma ceylanicum]|uniref:CCHC-type domain-containing protein n=1 Tax=Ancylostoma ceylanicum TaxID=53326 RepID=A0A016UFE9_9BILA|nr:hypothetical protein Y032_0043g826 [Ancylostoma ceylanicum]
MGQQASSANVGDSGQIDLGRLESIDPHVLLAIAKRKLQLDKGRERTFVGHRQLASWNGSYSLSEAIETSSSGEANENVKRAALRLERNRRAVEEMAQSSERKRNLESQVNRLGDSRFERFNNINGDRGRIPNHTQPGGSVDAMTHNRLGRSGREVAQSRPQNNTSNKGVVGCYSCGKRGHMARDCRSRSARPSEEDTRPSSNNDRQAGSFSALVDKLVGSVSMSKGICYSKKRNYDACNKADFSGLPRDRVNVKPKEKCKSEHSERIDYWSKPFRMSGFRENYAPLANIGEAKDGSSQHDMLTKSPHKVNDTPIRTKTKHVKRGRKTSEEHRVKTFFSRATMASDPVLADNSALGLFYVCPGAGKRLGSNDPEDYRCTVRDMTFADVIPEEQDPTIRSLRIHSIFSLARMISIYENETDVDKKRFLMRSPTHTFVTVSGAEKAYTFFKRNCEHVLKALLVHDGSNIAMASKENVNIDITQLNDLANSGVRFAQTHVWEDVDIRGPVRKTVLFVPCGLRGYARCLRLEEGVSVIVYDSLKDVITSLRNTTNLSNCIFLTPTTDKPYDASEWQALAMAMTTVARLGAKLVAVSSPRGEAAWTTHRKDTYDMFEVIKESAATMRSNITTMFTLVPSLSEPFACLGEKNRSSEVAVYPAEAVKSFFTALQKYVAPYVRVGRAGLYEVFQHPTDRARAYKEKKKAQKADGDITYRNFQTTPSRGPDFGFNGCSGPIGAEVPRGRGRGRGFVPSRGRVYGDRYARRSYKNHFHPY